MRRVLVGAKLVIVPECGHAYPALRFDAPEQLNTPLPFEVMAISEFIGREIKAGRLKVKKIAGGKKVTYHDPCKLGRHGGVFEEPRDALEALGVELARDGIPRQDPVLLRRWRRRIDVVGL